MILDKFLNESTYSNNVELVESSNEGFTFEDGGMTRAISLAESEQVKLEMAEMITEAKAVQIIADGRQNNLSESVIMEEVQTLQENVLTGTWAKIKEIAKKLWARILSILESVKTWILKTFNKSAFLKTAKSQLEKYNDFKDLEFEGYEYKWDAVSIDEAFKKPKSVLETAIGNIDYKVDNDGKIPDEEKNKLDDLKAETFKDKLTESVLSGVGYSEFKSKVMEKMRGGETSKKKISFNKSEAFKFIDGAKSLSNRVERMRSSVNNQFKTALAEIDKQQKEAEKEKNNADGSKVALATFKTSVLKQHSMLLNTVLTISSTVTDCALTVVKEETSQNYNHIAAALSQGKKNYNKAANESTYLGSGNFLDSILAGM